jgi:hypothetical protein
MKAFLQIRVVFGQNVLAPDVSGAALKRRRMETLLRGKFVTRVRL